MKKAIILVVTLAIGLLFVQCKSKEDKALALIEDYFFKTMPDYASYQPIEISIDSVFPTLYTDKLVLYYVDRYYASIDDYRQYRELAKGVRTQYTEDYEATAEKYLNEAEEYKNKIRACDSLVYSDPRQLGFYGWKAVHKYRCKTKDGSSEIVTSDFIIDEDFKEVLFTTADVNYQRNVEFIDRLTGGVSFNRYQ